MFGSGSECQNIGRTSSISSCSDGYGGGGGCFICYSSNTDNLRNICVREDVRFILSKVYQLPVDKVFEDFCGELGSSSRASTSPGEDSSSLFSRGEQLLLCGTCWAEIEHAKRMYERLVTAVKQFREIQERLVDLVKRRSREEILPDDELISCGRWAHRYRQFIVRRDYKDLNGLWMPELEAETRVKSSNPLTSDAVTVPIHSYLEFGLQLDKKFISDNDVSHSKCEASGQVEQLGEEDLPMEEQIAVKIEHEGTDDDDESNNNNDDVWRGLESETENEPANQGEGEDEGKTANQSVNTQGSSSENESSSNTSNSCSSDSDQSSFECDTCDFSSKTKRGLSMHKSRKHGTRMQSTKIKGKIKSRNTPPTSNQRKFKCPKDSCGASYPKRYLLTNHLSQHSEKDKLEFEPEDDNSTNLGGGEEHEERESGNEMERNDSSSEDILGIQRTDFKCNECGLNFKSKFRLSTHLSIKHRQPVNKLKLNVESRQFPPVRVPPLPTTSGEFRCKHVGCGKTFSRRSGLTSHASVHSDNQEFKCQYCSKEFHRKSNLTTHERTVHPTTCSTDGPTYPCDLCPKIYKTVAPLARHKKRVHGIVMPKERRCPQEECGKVFPNSWKLKDHLSGCHGWEPTHKCTKCDQVFATWKQKWRHIQKIHEDGISRKPYICEQCGKRFACVDYLSSHKSLHHRLVPPDAEKKKTGSKSDGAPSQPSRNLQRPPAICELCGKVLKNINCLKAHIIQVHEKDKMKHECNVCKKRFYIEIHLKQHLFHTHGIGPPENRRNNRKVLFKCPVSRCVKKFYGDKRLLEKHMIEIHGEDGKKPGQYKCSFCGKDFFQSTRHKYHEMAHKNKDTRPFICDICQKGFTTPGSLHFHKTYTHKVAEDRRFDSSQWHKFGRDIDA